MHHVRETWRIITCAHGEGEGKTQTIQDCQVISQIFSSMLKETVNYSRFNCNIKRPSKGPEAGRNKMCGQSR